MIKNITKKELKEQARYTKYKTNYREHNLCHGIFFDWDCKAGEGCGFKYVLFAWDCTKAQAYDAFMKIFVEGKDKGDMLFHCEVYVAETMDQRRKMPMSVSYFQDNLSIDRR